MGSIPVGDLDFSFSHAHVVFDQFTFHMESFCGSCPRKQLSSVKNYFHKILPRRMG